MLNDYSSLFLVLVFKTIYMLFFHVYSNFFVSDYYNVRSLSLYLAPPPPGEHTATRGCSNEKRTLVDIVKEALW